MGADRSWVIGRGPGFPVYRLYDAARRSLNRRLTARLVAQGLGGAVVVEVPSGPGSGTSALASASTGSTGIAVDIDLEALREGRRRDPALRAVVADVYSLPFRSGAIDAIWSSSSLEHLDAPGTALAEMHRVLRAAGRLFVGVPYRGGPLAFQPWIKRSAAGVWIGPVFGRAELSALVRAQGFEVLDTMTYGLRVFVGVFAAKRKTGRP